MADLLVRGTHGSEVQRLRQALVKQLGHDVQGFTRLGTGSVMDADVEAATRRWQSGVGLIADGVVGPRNMAVLGLRRFGGLAVELDTDAVKRLFPATKPASINRYLPYVSAALQAVGLTDRVMVCAALGTIRAESEGFLPIPELASQFNTKPGEAPFSAYENIRALGNTKPEDGALFKGRGFVQLRGRLDYAKYGEALGLDLLANPDLANAPEVAAMLLASFLAEHADALRGALAAGRFVQARKLVNGASHGAERFREVFKLADMVWPAAAAAARAARAAVGTGRKRAAAAKPAVAQPAATSRARSLTVGKEPSDLRDRPYAPPPRGMQDVFPSDGGETVSAHLQQSRDDSGPGPGGRLHRFRAGLSGELSALVQVQPTGQYGIGEPAYAVQLCAALRRIRG